MDATPTAQTPEPLRNAGNLPPQFPPYFEPPFYYSCGAIWGSGDGAEKLLDVRGWGHLTGSGAHGLKADVAGKIQDEIGEYVAALLTAHWPKK